MCQAPKSPSQKSRYFPLPTVGELEHCFNIALTAVYVSQHFWRDTNIGSPAIPKANIPPYRIINFSGGR
jgi:hypothetical protein